MKVIFKTFLLIMLIILVLPTCRANAESKKYKRTVEQYTIPDLALINQDGRKVLLVELLYGEQPVVVDFIYGTCTTICPVPSAGYSNLQRKLAADDTKPRLISITIDPENDSTRVMEEYLKRYGAKPGWEFLTESTADIDRVMRAFNAYIPDKMSHYPLNMIRSPKDGSWIRLFSIMSSRELMEEYQHVAGK